jgi:hypothetical protein
MKDPLVTRPSSRPRLPLPVAGILIPAVISLAGVVVALVIAPQGDVFVHWSIDGTPDGSAPAWTVVAGMAVLAFVAPLTVGLLLIATRRDGPSRVQKFLAGVGVWLAAFLTVLGLWILIGQRGGAESAPPVWTGLLLAAATGLVFALLAGWLTPPAGAVDPSGRTVAPIALAAGERAVWVGRTRLATAGIVAIVAAILFSLAAAIVAMIVTEGRLGAVLVVPLVLTAVLLLTSSWTVRVDDAGLEVRSAAGWPRFRMPAAQVASAGTTEVQALGEFGGWGIRMGRGRRLGIVMRSGAALEAQNRDGRALVVTVVDAGTAAALLGAVAERAATADGR